MTILETLFVIESITLLLVVFWYGRKFFARFGSRYTLALQPKAAFREIDNDLIHIFVRTIYESPEIGIYHEKLNYIRPHIHPVTQSLLYITKGKAAVTIGAKRTSVKPGDFVFVPNQIAHSWEPENQIEYLEISIPSLTATNYKDQVWLDEKTWLKAQNTHEKQTV